VLEAKFIPGLDEKNVEMALAWNKRVDTKGEILGTGYYNDWIYIKSTSKKGRSAFNYFEDDHVMRIPIAHGEGRYTTMDDELINILKANDQLVFSYCDKNGRVIDEFPINPNGTIMNIAGICNPQGNILALMPHPERTTAGQAVFDSIKAYLDKKFTISIPAITEKRESKVVDEVKEYTHPDIEILIDTVITDNEERTIERAIHDMGLNNVRLKKHVFYGIEIDASADPESTANSLIDSGEIVNLAKEIPNIVTRDKNNIKNKEGAFSYLTFDKDTTVGDNLIQTLKNHFNIQKVKSIKVGKKWTMETDENTAAEVVKTQIFHNPHSMDIYKV